MVHTWRGALYVARVSQFICALVLRYFQTLCFLGIQHTGSSDLSASFSSVFPEEQGKKIDIEILFSTNFCNASHSLHIFFMCGSLDLFPLLNKEVSLMKTKQNTDL